MYRDYPNQRGPIISHETEGTRFLCALSLCSGCSDYTVQMVQVIFFILDIPVGMYMQKYILLFSVVQSKPTHTLASRDQATGFS
jgi:hypothetical protein